MGIKTSDSMGGTGMACMKFDEEKALLSEISKYKRIMLYGCGEVGKILQRRLYQDEIEIEGFIVTDKAETEEWNGVPIYAVDEISPDEELLIIIAVREKLHGEILRELERHNVTHVSCVSDQLYEKLKPDTKKPREKLYFQIHIVEHCNLNCRGCYHFSPLAEEEYLSLEEYTRDIRRLSELFQGEMQQIMLLGGEPLLHPRLAEFLRVTRQYFPVGTIKILSNGILIPKMSGEFWKACEDTGTQLWLTKYPIRVDYYEIERIVKQHGKVVRYFSDEPVRTLGHQPLDISGGQNYEANFRKCYRANECILLEHGKMYTCLIAAESRHFSRYFGVNLEICDKDYVNIYEVESASELQERLTHPTPFCRYCNRDDVAIFGRVPWRISQRMMEEWTE